MEFKNELQEEIFNLMAAQQIIFNRMNLTDNEDYLADLKGLFDENQKLISEKIKEFKGGKN